MPFRAEPALEGRRHVDALGRLDGLEAEVARDLEPFGDAVDDEDLRALGRRDLGGDEADGSGTQDDRRAARMLSPAEGDRVDADRSHLPEVHAVVPRQVRGQRVVDGPLRGHGGELGVAPVAVHAVADGHVRGPALHDLARRPVPEHEREVDGRRAGLEQPELLVPLLVEVDVGRVAAVEGHLRAGAHGRAHGPDADLAVRERRGLVHVALDLAGLDDLDRAPTDLAARHDAVDRAAHARLPAGTASAVG